MTKIYAFETSRGVYTYISGESENIARANFPALAEAPLVGEVPTEEFFLISAQSPSVLYLSEAKASKEPSGLEFLESLYNNRHQILEDVRNLTPEELEKVLKIFKDSTL